MSPWVRKYKLTKQQVAEIIRYFLDGGGNPVADWDGFTLGMSLEDEYLGKIRIRCLGLSEEFPPTHKHEYCNEEGRDVLREYIRELTASKEPGS